MEKVPQGFPGIRIGAVTFPPGQDLVAAVHLHVTYDAIRFELRGWFFYQFGSFAESYEGQRGHWSSEPRVVGIFHH